MNVILNLDFVVGPALAKTTSGSCLLIRRSLSTQVAGFVMNVLIY